VALLQHEHSGAPRIALEKLLGDPVNVLWFVSVSEEERQVAIDQGRANIWYPACRPTGGNRHNETSPMCRLWVRSGGRGASRSYPALGRLNPNGQGRRSGSTAFLGALGSPLLAVPPATSSTRAGADTSARPRLAADKNVAPPLPERPLHCVVLGWRSNRVDAEAAPTIRPH
jgi:hypothetical protein